MIRRIATLFLISSLAVSCAKNPITGRNQTKLVPESELRSMAAQQYQQFLSTNKVVASSANRDAEMVTRVGQRVTRAVEEFFREKRKVAGPGGIPMGI